MLGCHGPLLRVAALPSKRRDPFSETSGAGLSKKWVEDPPVFLLYYLSR